MYDQIRLFSTPSIFWGMRVTLFKEWKGWVEQLISCLEPSGIFHFLRNFPPTLPLWMSRFLLPRFFCWNPLKQPFLLPNFLSVPLRGRWIGVCKSADLLWFVYQICPSIFALNPKSRQNVLITCKVQNPGPKNWWIRNPLLIAGSRNPLKYHFESKIRANIFSKSAYPFAYSPPSF